MKRTIPLLITFIVGLIVISSEFIPHRPFSMINSTLENWYLSISGFAIVLGLLSLVQVNSSKVYHKAENWQYSLASLVSLVVIVIFGVLWGMEDQRGILGNGEAISAFIGKKPFDYLFDNGITPLSSTMFSLLAFFIASAAYRAFIIRSFESNLLMITAVIVILGRTSFGPMLTSWLPKSLSFLHLPNLTDFILTYPSSAAQRAILMSASLGIIGSSLRIIIGLERSYLGSDE
ncbi:MAG: hypothetical protein CVU48_04435 [Candidatus Cloacimonetes bacterium HGW-Cloacimonetes-1]|nr:MAG: hypothetical protein CVU48_04435 [Candidatus Cloacimonetes bacterium HGW-Cloacimonetes-1]